MGHMNLVHAGRLHCIRMNPAVIQQSPAQKLKEESRRLGDDLWSRNRWAIIGCMTDGISHDIRNHLCAVYASLALFTHSTGSKADREELLKAAQSAIQTTIDMLKSLMLPSSSGRTDNFRPHLLNQVIGHVVKMVRIHPDGPNETCSFSSRWRNHRAMDHRSVFTGGSQ